MNNAKQHSAFQSILYHLIPGIFIFALIILFSNPIFSKSLGIDPKLSPVLGYLLSLLFGLIPIELGFIIYSAKKETGTLNIWNVTQYTQISRLRDYLFFVPVFIIYSLLMFVLIAPLIQPYIIQTLFSWWPEKYNFQLLLQNPASIAGYNGIEYLVVAYILLSCLFGPFVEELYFRGYLLPRMENFSGKWAPFLNTVLFSLYHFFSPWENLIRIVTSYPLIYLVWKKKDIRYSIFVHVLINTVGGIGALVIILNI